MGKREIKKIREKPFKGKKFVFTGSLKRYARSETRAMVEELGARAVNSVSKNIDYVVVGRQPGSKYEKAKRLGVKILNEEEFQELIEKLE